jgi:PilZ domain
MEGQVNTRAGAGATPDRRVQARYKVDEAATLSLVNSGSRMHSRILDLSLSGCRLHTHERFPLGIYTRVEAEFRVAGIPFRLGGVVQTIHGKHEIGVRFLDVSERKRQQVMELIEEIAEMQKDAAAESVDS